MAREHYGPSNPDATYVSHAYEERLCDTGVSINYATTGSDDKPALLLIPSQIESWWGYEAAMPLLADYFQVFAVDLRGQGRSSRTPGRYTWDNFGGDLVRFIELVIRRPTIVSGLSSGGVLAAWLSAYAMPGQVRGAHYEDPPLFSSEMSPAYGDSTIRQGWGPVLALISKYLGDQWSVGDFDGLLIAGSAELSAGLAATIPVGPDGQPARRLKEYDPEWARACWAGTIGAGCDHARMLRSVKCPVLLTHHFRGVDDEGGPRGALSDLQAARVRALVEGAGQPVTYRSFPEMGHSMHGQDLALFTKTLVEWALTLPAN